MDIEQIKQAVHSVLDERDGLDRERHRADHDWAYAKRQREQQQEQRRVQLTDKVRATVIGGVTLAMITTAGAGLYNVGKFVIDLYQKSQSGH